MRARRGALLLACLAGGLLVWTAGHEPPARGHPPPPPPDQPELAWLFASRTAAWWQDVPDPPPLGEPARIASGAAAYARLCAACHGPAGRGDGPLAGDLPRPPRDLAKDPLRTRSGHGWPARDLYRTLSAGAPEAGMPAFDHLPAAERWELVAHVLDLRGEPAGREEPLVLPPRPAVLDLRLGQAVWQRRCAVCHGEDGRGAPQAAGLLDQRGRPCPPPDLRRGPGAFRSGGDPADVARTILLGRPGTTMVPTPGLSDEALWATAAWVSSLAAEGLATRRRAWNELFAARRRLADSDGAARGESPARWDPARSAAWEVAPEGEAGCRACHQGISPISSGAMAEALDACAGGDPDRACSLCHGGDPGAARREQAHRGLLGNPGSLWVTSLGLGCGRCHSSRGALTSLTGLPLPEPRGGDLLSVRSRRTDPSGASGADHAYRMQRALMAQETGKVWLATASVGLVTSDAPRYTALPVDDPDGPEPCAGSPAYRDFMARASAAGHVKRLPRGEGLPDLVRAQEALGGQFAPAAYLDTYRKQCARCHLWGEGRPTRGERRSSGCSACHLLNSQRQLSREEDPTIPPDVPGHALRHEIVSTIPESQCNHCHTRGVETLHTDVHQVAGMGCIDCHTSIDVHGDGNLYAAIPHQLEVRCTDCHGSEAGPPWTLPLGYGSPAAGDRPRGTHAAEGRQHLLTSRGNPRSNWLREGERVVVISRLTGRTHVAPLLQRPPLAPPASEPALPVGHPGGLAGHERLACAACHNDAAPSCFHCHATWTPAPSQDWLLSALDYDPASTRQRLITSPGTTDYRDGGTSLWPPPELRPDPDGTLTPRIPGCRVSFDALDAQGKVHSFRPLMNPGGPDYPPPVAPSLPHENSLRPRTCGDCHPERR